MTKVDGTGASAPAPGPEAGAEADRKADTQAEFDQVIDKKAGGEEKTQKGGAGDAKWQTSGGEKPETARATEHGIERRQEGRDRQSGSGEGGSGQQEGQPHRPVPGDMMIPFQFQAAMQQIEVRAAAGLSTSEAVAQIQRIANQIVDAVQVRMNVGGSTDVKMELNMGSLGNMTVELNRTAEGQLRIDFQAQTVDGQDLLKTHMTELTSRLEARGMDLRQVSVRAPDQAEFKWQPQEAQRAEQLNVRTTEVVTQPQAGREVQWGPGAASAQASAMQPGGVAQGQASGQAQGDQQRGTDQEQERERKRKQEEPIEDVNT